MFLSIGFIAGHVITIPLLVGAIARIVMVDPLYASWFSDLPYGDFVLAFCSGMLVFGALLSVVELPKRLWVFLTADQRSSLETFSC